MDFNTFPNKSDYTIIGIILVLMILSYFFDGAF